MAGDTPDKPPATEAPATGAPTTEARATEATAPEGPATEGPPTGARAADGPGDSTTDPPGQDEPGAGDGRTDLKGIFRQLTAPMIESLDTRLRDQVETHVDELLGPKVEAAIADRLRTVDQAIASLSRTVEELEHRLATLERGSEPLDDL